MSVPLLGQGGHMFCPSNISSSSGASGGGFSGALGAIGLVFSGRAEAKANWTAARDYAIHSGNHHALPNGTHRIDGFVVSVTDKNIIYKNPETGQNFGIVRETGQTYTYSS